MITRFAAAAAARQARQAVPPLATRPRHGLASVAAMGSTLFFVLVAMLRLPKAAALASPSRKLRVSLPGSLAEGQPFVPPGRSVALFRDAQGGVYAISTICTHLSCVVEPGPDGFECPCHGSRFGPDGRVVKGGAPTALPWRKVAWSGGIYVVDEDATVPAGTTVTA